MAVVVASTQPACTGPLFDYVSQLQFACRSIVADVEASRGTLDSWIAEVLKQPDLGVLAPPPPLDLPNCRASFAHIGKLHEPLSQLSARLAAKNREAANAPSCDALRVAADALPGIECSNLRSPVKSRAPPSPCEESPTKCAKTKHHDQHESMFPFGSVEVGGGGGRQFLVPSPCRAAPSEARSLAPFQLFGPEPSAPAPHGAKAGDSFAWSNAVVSGDRPASAGSSADAAMPGKPCAPAWQKSRLFAPAPAVPAAPAALPAPAAPAAPVPPAAPVAPVVAPPQRPAASATAESLKDSNASSVSDLRRKFENARSSPCLHGSKSGMDATSMFAPMPTSVLVTSKAGPKAVPTGDWACPVPERAAAGLSKSASASGSLACGSEAAKAPSAVRGIGIASYDTRGSDRVRNTPQEMRPWATEHADVQRTDGAKSKAEIQESPELLVTPRGGNTQKVRPMVPVFQEKPEPWMALRQIRLAPRLAEDNYEISDQDSDVEVAENKDRSKKNVPRWCASHAEAVLKQADWDPDTIFSTRVPQCCLEDIFTDALYAKTKKQRPARKRGSSQDWQKDRLTKTDVNFYKTRMGQKKCWDESKAV